jgi:nucleotide-binding universal stress UspA family protein
MLLHPPRARGGRWDRLLVALDGCGAAEEILDGVAPLARALEATLHVLQVGLPILPYDDRRGIVLVPRGRSEAYLREVCDRLTARGLPAVPERQEGPPARGIAACAERLGTALITLASGRCGGGPEFQGSGVTDALLAAAPCSVLVHPKGPASEPEGALRGALKA